jgi:hypothetical protein
VVAVHGARDAVVWVQNGRAWLLRDESWRELAMADVVPGIGGHVMSEAQRTALITRVGSPA